MAWILTAASIVGVVLNVRKSRTSFAIWMITNASWAVIDFNAGIPAQGFLFSVYFVLAVWGFAAWGKKPAKINDVAKMERTG